MSYSYVGGVTKSKNFNNVHMNRCKWNGFIFIFDFPSDYILYNTFKNLWVFISHIAYFGRPFSESDSIFSI